MNSNTLPLTHTSVRCFAAITSVLILFFVWATSCVAKKTSAPLSPKILAAKTVYIENHGSAKLKDKAYDELKKWGRWAIVEDRAKANLVLVLSDKEGQTSTGQTQTYDPTPAPGMGGAGTWKYGTETSDSPGSTHLELAEDKTGETLYADTKRTARGIFKELRKRIE